MISANRTVPEDPARPGRDVLGVGLQARGHFIHEVLATTSPLSPKELGERAQLLARDAGVKFNDRTFTAESTRNHLEFLKKKDLVEQRPDKRWQFTTKALARLSGGVMRSATGPQDDRAPASASNQEPSATHPDIKTVDDKGRVSLPKTFANSTVLIEVVSPREIRIQKAVVIPEASLPTIEDALPPLSNEDRDFFLSLIDNPPEPNAAFLKAAKHYKEWHARNSD